ncbi:MAG: COX15/CtaA family protein [Elusimicrobia bacterium]|nr:COX15/CtaA family protein [Elusimicrobiota bacterium]
MSEAASLRPSRHGFARFSSVSAFFVLFAGGMVTSTGSALAVPDWPLAYGQYFPEMTGGVLFEHGHRMVAGLTALLVWALTAWTYWVERRAWVRAMMAAAALGILAQAVLGGATVLWGLPPQVSIAHAFLGQALFALVVACAQSTSPWFMARRAAPGRPWAPAALAVGMLFLQLALGATMRHTGRVLAWHLVGAVLTFWAVTRAALAGVHSERPSLGPLATGLMLLALLQVFLGFGALAFRHLRLISAMALLPTAHQAVGAALLGASVVLALRAGRLEEPA